jgi:RimJ/RimL family protein N-acetyltransferase
MHNITVRFFEQDDFSKLLDQGIRDKKVVKRLLEGFPGCIETYSKLYKDTMITILDGDEIFCIGFMTIDLFQNGEIMVFFDKDAKKRWSISLHRAIKEVFEYYKSLNVVRIEARCIKSKINQRFIKAFGFKYEGKLRKASVVNTDLYVYSFIKEERI